MSARFHERERAEEPRAHRPNVPVPVGLLALLWPSCILALIALLPRALTAPSASSLGPIGVVFAIACVPMVLALRAVRSVAHAELDEARPRR